jgi:drug/metabolite transporter (DMT)-like permease
VSARAWVLFAAMSLIWGVPYLFIKIAVDDGVPPLFVAWSRVALGSLVLLPIAAHRDGLRGLRAKLPWLIAFACSEICIPFPLISFGERHVTSSLTAILIASLPLLVAVLTLWVDPSERVSAPRLAGLICGLVGVVLLMGIDVAGDRDELIGALCILGATCGYAVGPMIIRTRLSDANPMGVSASALGIASIILLPALVITPLEEVPSAGALASIAVLGVVCSALAFVVFFALIVEAGPTRATVITYVNPAVAVLLGVTLLGENLGAASVAGLLLILAGSWTATGGSPPRLRRRRPVVSSPAGPQPARSSPPPAG